MEAVARYITSATFKSKEKNYTADFLCGIEETEDTVSIFSQVTLDGIERGWLGDIEWELDGRLLSDESKIGIKGTVKDALLSRINFGLSYDEPLKLEYIFLKD